MYIMRKLRELPEADVDFAQMLTFKALPKYDTPPSTGQLISDFDSFLLFKMKPLRKVMHIQYEGHLHAETPPNAHNLPVNTPDVKSVIPSPSSAFVHFVRASNETGSGDMLKRKLECV